tara:strand:- start:52 stop:594 length:543 start_codon:yes stop_codon:yes gene_type:complete
MKTNQDGGSYSAKKPSAPAKEMARNQAKEGAGKMGYAQKFGPGRASGYDKGAMKAMDVMSYGGASKYMGEGPAQGFFSKLGRTISRGAGDLGTQLADMIPVIGSDDGGLNRFARTQKQTENMHFDESRKLAKEGKTFGTLADYLDDDGKGNARVGETTNYNNEQTELAKQRIKNRNKRGR